MLNNKYFIILFVLLLQSNTSYGFWATTLIENQPCNEHIKKRHHIKDMSLESEYSFLASELLKTLTNIPQQQLSNIEFEKAINTTKLIALPSEHVRLNGNTVDAINYQNCTIKQSKYCAETLDKIKPHMIVINKNTWVTKNYSQKLENVFHEYLGVLGIERNVFATTLKMQNIISATRDRIVENNYMFASYPFLVEAGYGAIYICKPNAPGPLIIEYWKNSDMEMFIQELLSGYFLQLKEKTVANSMGLPIRMTGAGISDVTMSSPEFVQFKRDARKYFISAYLNVLSTADYSIFKKSILIEEALCKQLMGKDCKFNLTGFDASVIETSLR